jgi:uncharacterized membrane protein
MKHFEYLIAAIVLVVLDSIYLHLIKGYFNYQIKVIQGKNISINLTGAVLTYIFLIFGLNYFIIKQNRSITDAAFLGAVIYFVYECTNLALFDKWSLLTVFMDGIWGSVLFALTTFITYKIYKWFKM